MIRGKSEKNRLKQSIGLACAMSDIARGYGFRTSVTLRNFMYGQVPKTDIMIPLAFMEPGDIPAIKWPVGSFSIYIRVNDGIYVRLRMYYRSRCLCSSGDLYAIFCLKFGLLSRGCEVIEMHDGIFEDELEFKCAHYLTANIKEMPKKCSYRRKEYYINRKPQMVYACDLDTECIDQL